tara:strand:- start:853 stop:1218 length:366 start_codon:yes stop_codon:yes gene_type:complete
MLEKEKMQYFFLFLLFAVLHIFIWFSANWQLVEGVSLSEGLKTCIAVSIPISLLSFYATRVGYNIYESAWSVRLLAFGTSYLIFPAMTWFWLQESPFNFKTMLCIGLSFTIILIQVILPNS